MAAQEPNTASELTQQTLPARPRLLLVEDERIIAYDLKIRLTSMGYDVLDVVSSGQEALESARRQVPDCVVMDVVIEGELDGIQTAIALQDLGTIPIVFVTAFSDDSTFERASVIKEFAYVLKPFQERELHLTIKTVLQKHDLQKRVVENELRYRSLFEYTVEPMLLLDSEGNIKDVNTAAKQLLGPQNAEKSSIFQLFPVSGQQYIKQKWGRLLSKGRAAGKFKLEFKSQRKVLFLEIRLQANLLPGLHLASLDNVTASVESARKIQELARTSSDSPHPIIRFSTKGSVLYYNKAGLPFIYHWGNSYPDEVPPPLKKVIQEMGDGKPLRKLRLKLKGKTYSVRLVYVKAGAYVNFYGTDVTALQQNQALISSQRDALEHIAKGTPLAVMAKRLADLFITQLSGCKIAFLKRVPEYDGWVPLRKLNADSEILIKILQAKFGLASKLLASIKEGQNYLVLEPDEVLSLVSKAEPNRRIVHLGYAIHTITDGTGHVQMILVVKWRRNEKPLDTVVSLMNMACNVMSVALERDRNLRSLSQQALLFGNINDSVIMLNDQGIITDWNVSSERLFGYGRDQTLGMRLDELHLLPQGPRASSVTHTTRPLFKEVAIRSADGREGVAELSMVPLADSNKDVLGAMLLFRDITIRKQYEEHIRRSEANLLALVENTDDMICSVNLRGALITTNSAFHALMGKIVGEAEPDSETLLKKLPHRLAAEVDTHVRKALEGEKRFAEMEVATLMGEKLVLEISFNPMRDANNKLEGVSIFARNITQRKAAEDEIKRTNFELDSFVYRASHDLRAPLRSILGLLNLMDIDKSEAGQAQYINLVRTSINKLDTFIADLTHYSRNSRTEIEPEAVDFLQIIEDCLENLKFMDRAGRVKIYTDVYGNSTFYSDSGRLTVIFQNLISNALKYQDLEKTDPFLKIRVSSGERNAQILIEDNGKGIKSDYLNRIFDMFFRASEESYGSGLGLYITRQVIDKLKGNIAVTSQLGVGTTFAITIPNLNAAQPGPDERKSQLSSIKWFDGQ